ncbi:hypothetical protein FA13DRAFT_1721119 [Coprinellus micaceus]|uniref:Uncharacterized protein n=1 Tax=Coprinellus micaceus TaxID=71717 RepID=A0A4Y7S4X5_COPMI|nr:hypothetical protein FA13DRAFT_1721119 [Coprinellus micaceus]
MRFLLFILSFLYITSAVAFGSVVARRAISVSSSELETLTNAQRLARGLPPRAPKRLYAPTHGQVQVTDYSTCWLIKPPERRQLHVSEDYNDVYCTTSALEVPDLCRGALESGNNPLRPSDEVYNL